MSRAIDAFAGLGLGLLTGLLVGLSSTPVVAGVIGGLTAVLAGFFGLAGDRLSPDGLRIGSFSLAAVIGVGLGLVVRAHDLAAPSVQDDVTRWTKAGYSPADAREIVAFARYGIVPAGRQVGTAPASSGSRSNLFEGVADLCGRMETMPAGQQLSILQDAASKAGAGPELRALAVALGGAPGLTAEAVGALCAN